jgi:hypothetical protein
VVPATVKKVVVVGDLHGDLASLNHLIRINGFPSKELAYVFNGDFVDRGENSTEVLFFILGLLQVYPDRVFLNRGNHEDIFLNKAYGFFSELVTKYGMTNARVLKEALSRFYVSIPLCVWIPHFSTFISHAGPPILTDGDGASAIEIGAIPRVNFKHCTSKHNGGANNAKALFLEAMLWSDPNPEPGAVGVQRNSRGAGLVYSQGACAAWMKANGVTNFIRSHQCVQFGSEILRGEGEDEKRTLYTVFSSADYRGAGNQGALLVVSQDGVEAQKYEVDDFVSTGSSKGKGDKDHHCHVTYNREVVASIFRALDVDGNGELSMEEIQQGIAHVKDFKSVDDHNVVAREGDIEALFNIMDKNDNGSVGIEEFVKAFIGGAEEEEIRED